MKRTLGVKLALGFGVGVLGLILVTAFSWFGISRLLDQALTQSAEIRQTWHTIDRLGQAQVEHTLWAHRVTRALLDPDTRQIEMEVDPRQCDFGRWYYSAERRELERAFPQLREPMRALEGPHRQLHQSCLAINELLAQGELEAAQSHYLAQTAPLLPRILEQFRTMEGIIEAQAPGAEPLIAASQRHQYRVGLLGLLFVLAIGTVAALLARHIVGFLRAALAALAGASSEMAATSRQQESALTSQATAVNQTTVTIEELSRSSELVAGQAAATAESAARAQGLGTEGAEALAAMRAGTAEMKESVEAIGEQIQLLNEQTAQIGEITRLVREIAGQTNLLSLNASVEAARAGEQGRGFAVVAREIRKLADESRQSAEHIDALIGDIQRASDSAVMVGEEGGKAVERGTRLGEKMAGTLQAMSDAIEPIFENAQQIALNARQQAEAITQVRQAMEQVNGGMRESTAGVRQISEGVGRLDDLTREMGRLV